MTDPQEVADQISKGVAHYTKKGGYCIMCNDFVYTCLIIAFKNNKKDTMGPFVVAPICDQCRAINTDGSTVPLSNKIMEKIQGGKFMEAETLPVRKN